MAQKRKDTGQVRIIGGSYRSRRLAFPLSGEVKPTPDRVRETLFNWLMHDIQGANCLDLFAGSGILSFEALSRGAAKVTALEIDRAAVEQMGINKQLLSVADQALQIINQDAIVWLQQSKQQFNIIFLDPPYRTKQVYACLEQLLTNQLLADQALIYFEMDDKVNAENWPEQLDILKQKKAGKIYYYLAQFNRG